MTKQDAREISPQDEEAVLQGGDKTEMIEETEAISDVDSTEMIEETAEAISDVGSRPKRRSILGRTTSTRMSIIDRDEVNDASKKGSISLYDDDDDDSEVRPRPRESIIMGLVRSPSKRLSKARQQAFSRLFGDSYNAREASFVIFAGALIAFNSGFVNGCCVSGLLDPKRQASQSVAGFTSKYTRSALAIAAGEWENYGLNVALILSYMFGAFLCGLITPQATSYQIEPSYGPTFLVGGCFQLAASILAALEIEPMYVFCLAAAANGIQNGIASIYSANLIRCSLTGSSTDIALACAQALRGNRKGSRKAVVLVIIVASFWTGGVVSFYAVSRFFAYTLFFNAALFFLVGLSLVAFLVREVGISIEAAIVGNWRWKKAQKTLNSLRNLQSGDTEGEDSYMTLFELFDKIDEDKSGGISPDELLEALLHANVKVSAKEVRVLMKAADANGDGVIDRDEWASLVERIDGKSVDNNSRRAEKVW